MNCPSIINFNFSCKNPLGVMSEAILVQRIIKINLSAGNVFPKAKRSYLSGKCACSICLFSFKVIQKQFARNLKVRQ